MGGALIPALLVAASVGVDLPKTPLGDRILLRLVDMGFVLAGDGRASTTKLSVRPHGDGFVVAAQSGRDAVRFRIDHARDGVARMEVEQRAVFAVLRFERTRTHRGVVRAVFADSVDPHHRAAIARGVLEAGFDLGARGDRTLCAWNREDHLRLASSDTTACPSEGAQVTGDVGAVVGELLERAFRAAPRTPAPAPSDPIATRTDASTSRSIPGSEDPAPETPSRVATPASTSEERAPRRVASEPPSADLRGPGADPRGSTVPTIATVPTARTPVRPRAAAGEAPFGLTFPAKSAEARWVLAARGGGGALLRGSADPSVSAGLALRRGRWGARVDAAWLTAHDDEADITEWSVLVGPTIRASPFERVAFEAALRAGIQRHSFRVVADEGADLDLVADATGVVSVAVVGGLRAELTVNAGFTPLGRAHRIEGDVVWTRSAWRIGGYAGLAYELDV